MRLLQPSNLTVVGSIIQSERIEYRISDCKEAEWGTRDIMGCKWHKGCKRWSQGGRREPKRKSSKATRAQRLPREYRRDTGGYWGNNGV